MIYVCELWKTGCDVDWEAWSAVATAAAALIALRISGNERRTREAAESSESRIMAQLLVHALRHARKRLLRLSDTLDLNESSSGMATLTLAIDPEVSKKLAQEVSKTGLEEVTRLEARLHVLPPRVARSVMTAYLEQKTLQLDLAYLSTVAEPFENREHLIEWANKARRQYATAINTLKTAEGLCINASLGAQRLTRPLRAKYRLDGVIYKAKSRLRNFFLKTILRRKSQPAARISFAVNQEDQF